MKDSEIIFGDQLATLSKVELLNYYEKLVTSIAKGWQFEGRFVLKDYVRYELKERMR